MFEKLKDFKNAGIALVAVASGSSLVGCASKDEYGCVNVTSRTEQLTGCKADVLASRMADPKLKDSPDTAKLKSHVIGNLAEYVSDEIIIYKNNRRFGPDASETNSYLARCEKMGLDKDYPPSLKANVDEWKKIFSEHGKGVDNK